MNISEMSHWMKEHNISTEEFAAKLGVSYFTVAHWRQGTGAPSKQNVRRIKRIFPDCPLPEAICKV